MTPSPQPQPTAHSAIVKPSTPRSDKAPPQSPLSKSSKDGPRLVRIGVQANLRDLQPAHQPHNRPLYQVPWEKLKALDCHPCFPATHVAYDEWYLVINTYRGSGAIFDAFAGWLLSRDGTARAVVAKICHPYELLPEEEEAALAAIEREAALLNTALAHLQGQAVPRFYGVFQATSALRPGGPLTRLYVSIMEDAGTRATPEEEYWSFALMRDADKCALRAVVDAVHACGIVHRDIEPRNVLRRDGGDGLCLIDFGQASVGSAEELADEKTALEEALNMEVACVCDVVY